MAYGHLFPAYCISVLEKIILSSTFINKPRIAMSPTTNKQLKTADNPY